VSKADSTAKLTTIFAMPPEGGVEVPMVCPCCEAELGVTTAFDGTPDAHGTLPLASAVIECKACSFRASIWVGVDKVSIQWGSMR